MHGIIFTELKQFTDQRFGKDAWDRVLKSAGLGGHTFFSINDYADADMLSLFSALAKEAAIPVAEVVEDFGVFIAPDLLRLYSVLIKPEWRTLEVIENTEAVIHTVVRANIRGAKPPELKCWRIDADKLELEYDSPRKLCSLAKGIMRGIAAAFDERIEIVEHQCMNVGASAGACLMQIQRVSATNAPKADGGLARPTHALGN